MLPSVDSCRGGMERREGGGGGAEDGVWNESEFQVPASRPGHWHRPLEREAPGAQVPQFRAVTGVQGATTVGGPVKQWSRAANARCSLAEEEKLRSGDAWTGWCFPCSLEEGPGQPRSQQGRLLPSLLAWCLPPSEQWMEGGTGGASSPSCPLRATPTRMAELDRGKRGSERKT